jgi:formate-nitrite transporter family protein
MQSASGDRDRLSPVSEVPDLSPSEQAAVGEQSRPSAALIHETIRAEGESELERTWFALTMSGIAAGLSMGFSLVVEGLLQSRLPDAPWLTAVFLTGR